MNPTLKTLAVALVTGFTASGAFAAATASDTAANYSASWSTTPPNMGSGFDNWANQVLNNNSPPYAGTYLDQSSYNNPDGVLSAGYAWGTYANGGSGNGEIILVRPFLAGGSGSASLYNQTFSVGIGSGGIGGTGSAIGLYVGTAFSLSYLGGGPDNFGLSVAGGPVNPIPVNYANLNGGLLVSLTVSGPVNSASEGYTLAISPFAGGPAIYSTSGTFNSSAYNTSSFSFSDLNTSNDAFVNNLNITAEVPEPSSMLILGLSGLTTLLAHRRRS
jgi:hypothetical protein